MFVTVIDTKNCSLSIALTVTNKNRKSLKKWYYPPSHRLNVNVMLSNITLLMIFAVFDLHTLYHVIPIKWRSYGDHRFGDVTSAYVYSYCMLYSQDIARSSGADLQSTNVRKLPMSTTKVGCGCETEYSHNLTLAASKFNARPFSSFSSQQKLTQHTAILITHCSIYYHHLERLQEATIIAWLRSADSYLFLGHHYQIQIINLIIHLQFNTRPLSSFSSQQKLTQHITS